jgi:hypothetical protein
MEKIVLILACLASLTAGAEPSRDGGPIQGRYIMSSEHLDPPPTEKVDRVGIEIWGSAAKDMYNALESKEEPGCDIGVIKKAGTFTCSKVSDDEHGSNVEYFCHIGVLLKTGESVNAFEGC